MRTCKYCLKPVHGDRHDFHPCCGYWMGLRGRARCTSCAESTTAARRWEHTQAEAAKKEHRARVAARKSTR